MPDTSTAKSVVPLGQALVTAGLISAIERDRALETAGRWNVPLGQAVLALGFARPRDLYRALSEHLGLGFVDVLETPPDARHFRTAELEFYLEAECLPVARSPDGIVLATPDPFRAATLLADLRAKGTAVPPEPATFRVTARLDVLWTLQAIFEEEIQRRARLGLALGDPASSARTPMRRVTRLFLAAAAATVAACLLLAPLSTLAAVNVALGLYFAMVVGLKLLSIPYGIAAFRQRKQRTPPPIPPDTELPVYTIVVPLRDEASVLPLLADALRRIDYPRAKLDIKLVIESDDAGTLAEAKRLGLESYVEFIRVPPSFPRTKPKACNYALQFARGEHLVIFDAEDQPEPMQLKKAAAAFRAAPAEVACLQASLTYFNSLENWLTAQFTIEFNTWFDLLLPTASRLGMPIPLGGTSTHFRTEVLRGVGAWDPFNVTEDADLGIRLAQKGYRCEILDSTTYEEANCATGNWVRQRSRWIKGYAQTWLVHMRHPGHTLRAMGPAGFLGFHLLIGGSIISSLAHPVIWIVALAGLVGSGSALALMTAPYVPGLLVALNATLLAGGYVVSVAAGMIAVSLRGHRNLIVHAPMMVAYWPLISFAAYKAIFQLVTRPFYWEKTRHGISRASRAQLQRLTDAAGPERDP